MELNLIAKNLIIFGLFLTVLGVILLFANKIPFLGKLPGDILIKKENLTFYFPLTTSIVVSLVVSLILLVFQKK